MASNLRKRKETQKVKSAGGQVIHTADRTASGAVAPHQQRESNPDVREAFRKRVQESIGADMTAGVRGVLPTAQREFDRTEAVKRRESNKDGRLYITQHPERNLNPYAPKQPQQNPYAGGYMQWGTKDSPEFDALAALAQQAGAQKSKRYGDYMKDSAEAMGRKIDLPGFGMRYPGLAAQEYGKQHSDLDADTEYIRNKRNRNLSGASDAVRPGEEENEIFKGRGILAPNDRILQNAMLSDEQKRTYNYLYATQGAEEAEKFRDTALEEGGVNAMIAQKAFDADLRNSSYPGKIAATYIGAVEGAADSLAGVPDMVRGEEQYRPRSTAEYFTSEAVRSEPEESLARTGLELAQSAGTNTLAHLASVAGGPALGSAVFAAQAGSRAYNESLMEGHTVGEATAYGAMQALDEEITNYLLGGLSAYGGGAVQRTIGRTPIAQMVGRELQGLMQTETGRYAMRQLMDAIANNSGEAAQEYLQHFTEEFEKWVAYNHTSYDVTTPEGRAALANDLPTRQQIAASLTDPEALHEALIGFLNAGLMNAPGQITEAADIMSRGRNDIGSEGYAAFANGIDVNPLNYSDAETYHTARDLRSLAQEYSGRDTTTFERGLFDRAAEDFANRAAQDPRQNINGNIEDINENVDAPSTAPTTEQTAPSTIPEAGARITQEETEPAVSASPDRLSVLAETAGAQQSETREAQRQAIVDTAENLDSENLAAVMNGATMLSEAEKQAAYQEGMNNAVTQMRMEAQNEGSGLSGEGSGRTVSLRTGEQNGGVSQAAGGTAESWTDWSAAADSSLGGRDGGTAAEVVETERGTPAEKFLRTATPGQTIYRIKRGSTPSMRKASAMIKKYGGNLTEAPFASSGDIMTRGGESARAFADPSTRTIGYRINSEDAESDKLVRHELVEFGIMDGKVDVSDALKTLSDRMNEVGLGNYVNIISSAYAGGSTSGRLTGVQALEAMRHANKEMLCDISAGINQFKGVRGYEDIAEVVDVAHEIFSDYMNERLGGAFDAESDTDDEILEDANISVNESGTVAHIEYSTKYSWKTDEEIERAVEALQRSLGVSKKKARAFVESERTLTNLILSPGNVAAMDYEADDRYKAIKKNSDYPQGTVDFNNNCRKRVPFTSVFNRLQMRNPNRVFTAQDLETIRQTLIKDKVPVACALCYVEERRQRLGEIANSFVNLYNNNGLREQFAGKRELPKIEDALEKVGDDPYRPTINDLITYEGLRKLSKEHAGIAEAFEIFNNARGMQAGRLVEGRAEYKRELLKLTKAQVKRINDLGGLRVFSYSDFEAVNLLDIVQVIQDAAVMGIKIQAYTKVPAFAKVVRNTGIKLNRSLIAAGTGVRYENGRAVLDLDPVEGIDINDPDFFDSTDDRDVGNILVGMSDEQIRLAMTSPFVDYIIPFHTSLPNTILKAKGIDHWTNYKLSQTDKDMKTGKNAKNINIYTEVLQAAKDEGKPIRNKRQFVEKFLQVAKEKNLIPRFSQFLNVDKNGNYVYTEGYHKFLIDFKLFDKNGNIVEQEVVRPEFDDAFNTKLMEDFANGAGTTAVTDAIYNDVVNALNEQSDGSEVQYSSKLNVQLDEEYMKAVNSGNIDKAREMVESAAADAGFTNAIPEQTLAYKVRTGKAPQKTMKVYKVFTVAPDGTPTALFVSGTQKLPQGVWLDAQDTWHFTAANGEQYVPSTQNPYTDGGKTGASVEIPNDEIRQELIRRGFLKEGSKAKKITALAYRPGWHAGDLPFFPQGGMQDKAYAEKETEYGDIWKQIRKEEGVSENKAKKLRRERYGTFDEWRGNENVAAHPYKNIHRYNQVVFECEIAFDHDYTRSEVIQKNGESKGKVQFFDMQKMPVDGGYKFATNPMANANDIGSWYISGSLKIGRALTQEECDAILKENGRIPQSWERGEMDLESLGYTGQQYEAARKTLAPVTYDDDGNVIPLSKRFDPEVDDVRYSSKLQLSGQKDSDSTELTASQADYFKNSKVRDADGNLQVMYHGTNADFNVFDTSVSGGVNGTAEGFGIYLSDRSDVSDAYGDRLIKAYVNVTKPASSNKKTITRSTLKKLIKATAMSEAEKFVADGDYENVNDAVKDSWISNYTNTYEKSLSASLDDVANQLLRMDDNDMGIIQEVMAGMGIRDYAAAYDFYDVLKRETGFDGFETWWTNAKNQGDPARIVLAFDSNQVKNIDNENPTDNPDIRYSSKLKLTDELLADLIEKYGALPKGENAQVDVSLPAQTSPGKKTRRYARTVLESGLMSDKMSDEVKKKVINEALSYEPMTDKASAEYAASVIKIGGVERAQREWDKSRRSDTFTKDDMAVGQFLLKEYASRGDLDNVLNMVTELAAEGTRMGQNIQAMRMLKKYAQQVPEIGLGYIQRTVDQMNRDAKKKMGKKYKEMKISPALASEYLNANTPDAVDAALGKIYKNLGEQVQMTGPEAVIDKLRTWRYLSMLGNPRTHVRNFVGNAIFVPAVRLKNVIGAEIEKSMGAERTKGLSATPEARAFAMKDALLMRDALSGKADMSIRDLIMEQRKVYKIEALNKLSKANSDALEGEDWIFLRMHYQDALAKYITANNMDVNNMDGQKLAKARNYALKEAQKATYRDANKVSAWLNQSSGAGTVVKYMMEGMLPFKKTPTNILRRGVEYSPAGLIGTLTKGTHDLNTGKITLNEYIDGIASGLSGTAIFGVGMFLASVGAILGGYVDDEDKERRKLRGDQEYAVRIGDHTYTVDWAAPGSLPLFIGVETMYGLKRDHGMTFSDITAAATRLVDPMINMSMLSGLNDTLDAISYSDDKLSAFASETFYSLLGQYVPTISGQIARTIDTTQRINYQDKNTGLSKNMLYFIEKMQNKIPYLTFSNDPYLNEFGQENVTESRFVAAIQNFISPGYLSKVKDDRVLDELDRLSEAQDENVLPKKMPKYLGTKEDRVDLTSEQYTTFQRTAGQLSYNIIDNMIDDKRYSQLTAEQQADAISIAYSYAKAAGRIEIQPEYKGKLNGNNKKVYNAVQGGSQAYDVILQIVTSK